MNFNGFEKIANNCDILINIFKYLKFSDQLRLTQVSPLLESIFHTYIWRDRYSVMTILGDHFDYSVLGDNGTASLILNQTDFEEFLDVYADNVLQLAVRNFRLLEITDINRVFRNLKKLEYVDLRIPSKHVHELHVLYPKLEELSLRSCSVESYPCVMFGETLSINALSKMTHLRRLTINNINNWKINYNDFRQAVTRLKLESLKINAIVKVNDRLADNETALESLKELTVILYPINMPTYLINLENLITLNVQFSKSIDEYVLQSFVESCKHLQNLIIEDTMFKNINQFCVPPEVTKLALRDCNGLTTDNLKQILTQFRVTKFTSIGTRYEGDLEPFQISSLLELLDVDAFSTYKFTSSREKELSNLKELWWYDERDHHLTESMFSHISLESCPNLEKLIVYAVYIPLNPLLQLTSLTHLTISDGNVFMSWAYIIALLKHSSLIKFELSGNIYHSILCERADVPTEGFSMNVKHLEISLLCFQGAFKFWINLLRCNEDLKLICHNFKNFEFLKTMVNDEHFPRSIRTIDMWGFIISTKNLRRRFNATLNKFIKDASYLNPTASYFGNIYRLILCRN